MHAIGQARDVAIDQAYAETKWISLHGHEFNVRASRLAVVLRGLSPALVQTARNDVLRDQGEEYARK